MRRPRGPAEVLTDVPDRGVIARGLGRAYGDAALNAGGVVEDMTALTGVAAFDAQQGEVVVAAGTALDELLAQVLPGGWWLPVLPGTRRVTVGGAIAADVHGKNHLHDGSFADHVISFRLRTPDGTDHDVTADDEVFWATAGGMGLTGAVLRARLRLRRVETARCVATHRRTADLDETIAALGEGADQHRYAAAWLDLLASGRARGRGIVSLGDHATADEAPAATLQEPLGPIRLRSPRAFPSGLLRPTAVRAFNRIRWLRAGSRPVTRLEPLTRFFFPLDVMDGWNRLYGRRGFVQYQFAVPLLRVRTLHRAIDALTAARCPVLLATLKRFGPGHGYLSFPLEGWTLALDIPIGSTDRLPRLLRELDELVLEAEGRVYLAKDARLDPTTVRAMYPQLTRWMAIRERLDPQQRLRSDLARRLEL